MSYLQYKRALEVEIEKVNEIIDFKVVHGKKYGAEARRHKALTARMQELTKHGFFYRFRQMIATIALF